VALFSEGKIEVYVLQQCRSQNTKRTDLNVFLLNSNLPLLLQIQHILHWIQHFPDTFPDSSYYKLTHSLGPNNLQSSLRLFPWPFAAQHSLLCLDYFSHVSLYYLESAHQCSRSWRYSKEQEEFSVLLKLLWGGVKKEIKIDENINI
jgi:hypothetical protein